MTAIAQTFDLPRAAPSALALGAFLKNTICVTVGPKAYVSADHGDLGTPEAIAAFEASVEALLAETKAKPIRAAHDLHPDFHSTRFAQGLDLPLVAVQHHHAHAASIAAENGHDGPLVALSLDGFGLGPGNESWGGELLWVDGPRYRRLGHLARLPQPGGDKAAREPWRMAAAALHRLGRGSEIAARFAQYPAAAMLGQILDKGLNCPETSSAGRLFDAACGLLGVHLVADFEGQAPMALERMANAPVCDPGLWHLSEGALDFSPLLERLAACAEAVEGANLFHGTLIEALSLWAAQAARDAGVTVVALGGGCFLNKVLTKGVTARLAEMGLRPLTALKASPGDAGLSLGQAWIASLSE